MWQTVFGIIVVLALAALLARQFLDKMAQRKAAPFTLFGEAAALLSGAVISEGEAAGSYRLNGRYQDHDVQVKAITDTLAVRKLPSLWLMVTLPGTLPVRATFDLMMRPAGPTTFSNFEQLPYSIQRPPEFPEHANVRTDDPAKLIPPQVVAPHLAPFFGPRAKELLISPKGLRIVMLLAEADRARYGVFRQADFGDIVLAPAMLKDLLDRLVALRKDIEDWHSQAS